MSGMLVRYRVSGRELAVTIRGAAEHKGSVHHAELVEFTGLITRRHAGGVVDIVIFPPDKAPVHVKGVPLGEGAGMAEAVGGK